MTYTIGKYPTVGYPEEIPSTHEMQVGEIIYIEVAHEVSALMTPREAEKRTAQNLWNHIIDEGQTPIYVKTEVTDVDVKWRRGTKVYCFVMWERYIFRVKKASPIAISIAVGWAVVALALIVVAWLTSPYWGPLTWRWAGYEPGEAPPSAPSPPFPGGDIGFILIAVVAILVFAFLMFGRRK